MPRRGHYGEPTYRRTGPSKSQPNVKPVGQIPGGQADKLCPLRIKGSPFVGHCIEEAPIDACLEELCAWWVKSSSRCAVVIFGCDLGGLIQDLGIELRGE